MPANSTTALMAEMVAYGAFPGAVLMASRRGEIVIAEAVGQLTYGPTCDSTSIDSIYEFASVTKVFTSVAVLRLIADRQLALETHLGDLLSGIPTDLGRVTMKDLLGHTSGLPSLPDLNLEYDRPIDLPRGDRAGKSPIAIWASRMLLEP